MIADVLGYGAANARTKEHIAAEYGVLPRVVEQRVQEARLAGAPICSDERGYWLGTAEEVEACARRLRSRYIHQAMTARAMRKTARRLAPPPGRPVFGQLPQPLPRKAA